MVYVTEIVDLPRSPKEATEFAYAQSRHETRNWHNDCELFVRLAYGVPTGKFSSATTHMLAMPDRAWIGQVAEPFAGSMLFFDHLGENGHVGIAAGGPYFWTNDLYADGQISKARITDVARIWGGHYVGAFRPWYPGYPPVKPDAPTPSPVPIPTPKPPPAPPVHKEDALLVKVDNNGALSYWIITGTQYISVSQVSAATWTGARITIDGVAWTRDWVPRLNME